MLTQLMDDGLQFGVLPFRPVKLNLLRVQRLYQVNLGIAQRVIKQRYRPTFKKQVMRKSNTVGNSKSGFVSSILGW
jgi:hypothetical protein